MKGKSSAIAQAEQARVVDAIRRLQLEFRRCQMPVEEALAMLAMKLLSLEYAVRYETGNVGNALSKLGKTRARLLKRIHVENQEQP